MLTRETTTVIISRSWPFARRLTPTGSGDIQQACEEAWLAPMGMSDRTARGNNTRWPFRAVLSPKGEAMSEVFIADLPAI